QAGSRSPTKIAPSTPRRGFTSQLRIVRAAGAPWVCGESSHKTLKGFHNNRHHAAWGRSFCNPFRVDLSHTLLSQGALPAVATLGWVVKPFQGSGSATPPTSIASCIPRLTSGARLSCTPHPETRNP